MSVSILMIHLITWRHFDSMTVIGRLCACCTSYQLSALRLCSRSVLHGSVIVSQKLNRHIILPYWFRRLWFCATLLVFLPLFCGLAPFELLLLLVNGKAIFCLRSRYSTNSDENSFYMNFWNICFVCIKSSFVLSC